jgi:plastocyanin
MHSKTLFALGSITLLSVAMACGGGSPAPSSSTTPAAPGAPAASAVNEATAGNINGKIVLEGASPKEEAIRMNADPVCVREVKGAQTTEMYVVGDGGSLGNVFVYVKDGLGNYTYPAPSGNVVLDQKGCRYHPHVFGIRVGQALQIVNSDPTLHNIHALPKSNQEFNTGQPIQGMKTDHTFTAREVMVPFKCDVHGWMNAYVGVLDHPYFAVTGADGTFALKSVPPGTYTVEAWHEKFGAQTQSVTIGDKETKDVSFTFKVS